MRTEIAGGIEGLMVVELWDGASLVEVNICENMPILLWRKSSPWAAKVFQQKWKAAEDGL